MNKSLGRILQLKRVLASIGSGRGISGSIVLAFRDSQGKGKDAARKVLLGQPPRRSMALLASDESTEVGMLASLIALSSGSDVATVGKKGAELSAILERWLKAKEARVMEARVLQMRGFIMSAVLGAVMAIMSALGPVVSTSSLFGGASPAGSLLYYAAGTMVAVSSSMIGLFMSGRGFYLNLMLALSVFWVTLSASSPLVSIPAVDLWGIK